MPRLELTINVATPPDPDGDVTRMRKTIDVWDSLTATQQTTLTVIHTRIKNAIKAKYGADTNLESMQYVVEG